MDRKGFRDKCEYYFGGRYNFVERVSFIYEALMKIARKDFCVATNGNPLQALVSRTCSAEPTLFTFQDRTYNVLIAPDGTRIDLDKAEHQDLRQYTSDRKAEHDNCDYRFISPAFYDFETGLFLSLGDRKKLWAGSWLCSPSVSIAFYDFETGYTEELRGTNLSDYEATIQSSKESEEMPVKPSELVNLIKYRSKFLANFDCFRTRTKPFIKEALGLLPEQTK